MPKPKKANLRRKKAKLRRKKSNKCKTNGKKGIKPQNKPIKVSLSVITEPCYGNLDQFAFHYDTLDPVTVNSIARARKTERKTKGRVPTFLPFEDIDISETDSDNSDGEIHDLYFIAVKLGFDFDTPIPVPYLKYFDCVIEEEDRSHHSHNLKFPDSGSDISSPFSMFSPETTSVREPFLSPLDQELEDHVSHDASLAPSSPFDQELKDPGSNDASHAPSPPFDHPGSNDASHAPSPPFDQELKDPGSNDASHILGGPLTRSKTKKEKQELKKTL